MDLGLRGRIAVVTGSSRGIGRAIARGLGAEGAGIVLCARGEDGLRQAGDEIRALGAEALAVPADVTVAGDIDRVVAAAVERFGRLDILVNNAGGSRAGDSDEDWDATYQANLLAAARATRAAAPEMRRSGGGSIVHIASIWGREAGGAVTYNALKAAMISHAKNMALALAHDNIRVNSVAPGSIAFPGGSWQRRLEADPQGMQRWVEQNIATGRFGRPEEVADVVVFLCSARSSWVTGACINVDGGQTKSNI